MDRARHVHSAASAASGSLTYTAQVRAGGDVEGRMVFRGGVDGELAVSGNLRDGRLSYHGQMNYA